MQGGEAQRMAALSFHESIVEKSIIAQLPDSPDPRERLALLQAEVQRLSMALDSPFSQYNASSSLSREVEDQKSVIKRLSEELRNARRGEGQEEFGRLEEDNRRLREVLQEREREMQERERELQEARGRRSRHGFSQAEEELRRINMAQEVRLEQMAAENRQKERELSSLRGELQRARRDQQAVTRSRQSFTMQNSRSSQMEQLQHERLALKLAERTRQYDQLYAKYQSLQGELMGMEETQRELQREREFLAGRLSDIEIHTEGDEVVGELENKLVLMSTELMRLGHLNRTKTAESKQLTTRVQELIIRKEQLEKQLIERDQAALTLREQLRMTESRMMMERDGESSQERELRERNGKLGREIERMSAVLKEKLQASKNAEIRAAILEEKNQRLERELNELERENRELNTTHERSKAQTTLLRNLEADVTYYKEAAATLKEELRRIDSKLQQARQDCQQLSRERDTARSELISQTDTTAQLREETRRASLKLEEREDQLRELAHRSEERLIEKTNEVRRLEERLASHERELQRSRYKQHPNDEFLRERQQLEQTVLTLRLQITDYQDKLALVAQENQRLTQRMTMLGQQLSQADRNAKEVEAKEKRMRELMRENENMGNRERRAREEADALRERVRALGSGQTEREALQFRLKQVRDDLQSCNLQLSAKQEECLRLQSKYQQATLEIHSLELRVEQPQPRPRTAEPREDHEFELLKEQRRRDAGRIAQLEGAVREGEEVVEALSGEVERLNLALCKRMEEVGGYRKEIDFLQHKVRTCEQALQNRRTTQVSSEQTIADSENRSKIEFAEGRLKSYEGELDVLRQRCAVLRENTSALEGRVNGLLAEKAQLEQRVTEQDFQLRDRQDHFRTAEESFKTTVQEIKASNQRLESSLAQLESHYLARCEARENECGQLRKEKNECQARIRQLEERLAHINQELRSKEQSLNHMVSNHSLTRIEADSAREATLRFESKVQLLEQQLERAGSYNQQQAAEIERLRREVRTQEERMVSSLRESGATSGAMDTLCVEIERLNSVLADNLEKMRELQRRNGRLEAELQATRSEKDHLTPLRQQAEQNSDQLRQQQILISKYQEAVREAEQQVVKRQRDEEILKEELRMAREEGRAGREQAKTEREMRGNLERKLEVISRQYEQLVVQIEQLRRPKANSEQDEKMRILGSYEATIKHMKEEAAHAQEERVQMQQQNQQLTLLAHQMQEKAKLAEQRSKTSEERGKAIDQRYRAIQQRNRRSEDKNRILQQRLRLAEDSMRAAQNERPILQQRLQSAMQEVNRLQQVVKTRETEVHKLQSEVNKSHHELRVHSNEYYAERIQDKKGIFVIKEASEVDERSRSASGNGPQPTLRQPVNSASADLQHRYQLLQAMNRKLTGECECLRKANVEYEFKMNKLREEFTLINRLVKQYREQNDKLKDNARTSHRSHLYSHISPHLSPHLSPQHSSIMQHPRSAVSPPPRRIEEQESRGKLGEEIDRLTRVNLGLQNEVHDLRLNSTDNLSLRKRLEESAGLMVLLFVEVEALRMRVPALPPRQ